MNLLPRVQTRVLCVAAVVWLLSACGGGGGGGDPGPVLPSATVVATDDAVVVSWNAPTTIDVAANDSASRGTVTLESVGAPLHGQAAVVQGKLVYTPEAGYFGADSLVYTVRADAGGATASAAVELNVMAQLQVAGTVSDGPVANAVVTVRVGDMHVATVADAQGRYVATLRSSRAADFVAIDALGVSAQSKVKLRSLVGQFGTLLSHASGRATLTASQIGTLDVTHFSSALAVLAAQSNGGQSPNSDAQLTRAKVSAKPAGSVKPLVAADDRLG